MKLALLILEISHWVVGTALHSCIMDLGVDVKCRAVGPYRLLPSLLTLHYSPLARWYLTSHELCASDSAVALAALNTQAQRQLVRIHDPTA